MTWLDPRIWLAVIVAVVTGAAAGYSAGHRDADQSATVTSQKKEIDDLRAARDDLGRRLAKQKEIATDAAKERDQAVADAAAADGAADGLRKQVAALVDRAKHSGVVAGGPTTGDALDLLADVFGRADARAGELASIADKRGVAGRQCERSYDALMLEAQPKQSR
ncbi:DUF2514 family protein [Burkholderia cenocepacia]|uniref:DUF2514 family protein n=1 Tax=Burkholderia cenocepacia TaxID=95486 RepID=UPI002ABD2372|nr:DUF2514 family protein [Burkholderia cenocepacia]